MSDARKILDERLAKGEISPDEHQSLIERIDTNASVPTTPNETTQPPATSVGSQPEADDPNKLNKTLLGISLVLWLLVGYTVRIEGRELNQLGSLAVLVAAGCLIYGAATWTTRK